MTVHDKRTNRGAPGAERRRKARSYLAAESRIEKVDAVLCAVRCRDAHAFRRRFNPRRLAEASDAQCAGFRCRFGTCASVGEPKDLVCVGAEITCLLCCVLSAEHADPAVCRLVAVADRAVADHLTRVAISGREMRFVIDDASCQDDCGCLDLLIT